ncbi:MAG: hypothetical protein K2J15_02290 [Muribaculaceae bacterium]|nr:hypothetical protein [Muribaculaceae bacterium]
MQDILVPIFVCVVLPVSIVLIVFLASINTTNKKAMILIRAIESNNGIDADKLAETLKHRSKTERELLNLRLLRGCIFSLIGISLWIMGGCMEFLLWEEGLVLFGTISLSIGISYLIVYFVSRKHISDK